MMHHDSRQLGPWMSMALVVGADHRGRHLPAAGQPRPVRPQRADRLVGERPGRDRAGLQPRPAGAARRRRCRHAGACRGGAGTHRRLSRCLRLLGFSLGFERGRCHHRCVGAGKAYARIVERGGHPACSRRSHCLPCANQRPGCLDERALRGRHHNHQDFALGRGPAGRGVIRYGGGAAGAARVDAGHARQYRRRHRAHSFRPSRLRDRAGSGRQNPQSSAQHSTRNGRWNRLRRPALPFHRHCHLVARRA